MPPTLPIDPLDGPKLALAGDVVTMDDSYRVVRKGVVYIDKGCVVEVRKASDPAPEDFKGVSVVATKGTMFPGLIELHNHLSYNALPLWNVPKPYGNRDQWSGTPEYRKLVSGPMNVIGHTPKLLPALVRYVECKTLMGGVTTTQGIQLFSNNGIRKFYRGLVRNVENTDEASLPEALTKIADVEAKHADLFLARLMKQTCFLLHLSEGTDETARQHFLALQIAGRRWAITRSLAGIHSTALHADDFRIMASKKGAMVWSPLSNLLLYGDTAKVAAAKKEGVRIGIGPDWSPSGSKNLLGELKVASLVSKNGGDVFSDREIVAMATRTAASILEWDRFLGTLEAKKRADLLVLDGEHQDPYAALLAAKEADLHLVMINGVARYGSPSLMNVLAGKTEEVRVGGVERKLYFEQRTADDKVVAMSLGDARQSLSMALHELPKLAKDLETKPSTRERMTSRPLDAPEPEVWYLALDELQDNGVDLRPRLPLKVNGKALETTGPERAALRAGPPLSEILEPIALDPLTVADHREAFLESISKQLNLPEFCKQGLAKLY